MGSQGLPPRLPILFSEGVAQRPHRFNRFVALTSTNHAKTYGLYPRKARSRLGADADVVIWYLVTAAHGYAWSPDGWFGLHAYS